MTTLRPDRGNDLAQGLTEPLLAVTETRCTRCGTRLEGAEADRALVAGHAACGATWSQVECQEILMPRAPRPAANESPAPLCAVGPCDQPSIGASCPSCCYDGEHCPKCCEHGAPF